MRVGLPAPVAAQAASKENGEEKKCTAADSDPPVFGVVSDKAASVADACTNTRSGWAPAAARTSLKNCP